MKDFALYFNWGLQHILTWEALDHILFVTALCLRYEWRHWKKVIILVTAFTIGHCITLLLSTFDIIKLRTEFTEFFIALTIIFTALSNAFVKGVDHGKKLSIIYFLALLFGMIHGLGFAYGLKSILGKNVNVVWQLLAFNTGIEVAQLLIVAVGLTISFFFIRILRVPFRVWVLFVSGIIFGISLQMVIERFPFKKTNHENNFSSNFILNKHCRNKPISVL